jgi:hypothetical protein
MPLFSCLKLKENITCMYIYCTHNLADGFRYRGSREMAAEARKRKTFVFSRQNALYLQNSPPEYQVRAYTVKPRDYSELNG